MDGHAGEETVRLESTIGSRKQHFRRTVMGCPYRGIETVNSVILIPLDSEGKDLTGGTVLIIDKLQKPNWRSFLTIGGGTLFPRINTSGEWLYCAILNPDGGVSPIEGDARYYLYIRFKKIELRRECDYPDFRLVHWDFFPIEAMINFIGEGREDFQPNQLRPGHIPDPEILTSRLAYLASLGPTRWWRGTLLGRGKEGRLLSEDLSREYFVAEFIGQNRKVAIADSALYRNAIYYMAFADPEDMGWQSVFALTKREARQNGATRLVHNGAWTIRVQEILADNYKTPP